MPEYDLWAEKVCTIYLVEPGRQLGPPTEPFHTAHWTPIESVAQLLGNAGDRHFASMLARYSH